ncbi:MAG: hypothetical protein AB1483_04450 [Candidatus Zixiibacteriota bacterium]
MGEITYTVNESGDGDSRVTEIRTTITAAQRGTGAAGATGCAGEVSRCGHFTSEPAAEPDRPSVDFTGRYECDGGEGVQPCTVQINQAGDYVYGWFQIDFYAPDGRGGTVLHDAFTGYFSGEVGSSGGPVEVVIEAPQGQSQPRSGHISNVRAHSGRVRSMRLALDSTEFRAFRGRSYTMLHWFDLNCVSNQPRMSQKALTSIRNSNRVLYQAEAHPLRTMQVRAMRRWIEEILVPRINACLGQRGTSLMGPFHGLFNTIFDAFSERNLGEFFRQEQTDLVRTVFLRALETVGMTLPGSGEEKVILEVLYQIADSGETEDQRGIFRRFRAMFGEHNGEPVLPEHLGRYKYNVRVEYRQGSLPIPSSGVSLGGRRAEIRMTRSIQQGRSWQQDGDPHTFEAAVGIVKVELSGSASGSGRGGRGRGGGSGGRGRGPVPSVEAGLSTFDFQSYRRWTWDMFPGYFEVFEAQVQIKLPFGIIPGPSLSDVAISFYGSGDVPPLIADVENSSTISLDNGTEFQAQVGVGWYPGWLWADRRARERSAVDPTGLPPSSVRWADRTYFCFPVDVESVCEDGRDQLGIVLAENLILLLNGHSHLRLDGHASRPGSSQHNMVLSIRRSQFALQALVDILGEKLEIPLIARAQSEGDGTIRLFAFGEQEAARAGDPESMEISVARRVDVSVNGSAVARLTVTS